MQSEIVKYPMHYRWAHQYKRYYKLLGYIHIATKGSMSILVMGIPTNQSNTHMWQSYALGYWSHTTDGNPSFPLC